MALRSENGGLYIVNDNAVYFNDGKELLEGLVSDIVTYEDGTFDGENYEVVKDSIVPKGCCSAFRVAFERDMLSCVVTIGYDGSAVLYACGEKFCCVNNILSQLMKYKVNETMLTRGDEVSDVEQIYGAFLDFGDAGSHSSVSLNLDTSVRLVEMLKEGLEPDALLYVVNGLVYQRSGEYSLKGRDGVWRSGSLSVSVPSMESFIEAYNRRHVSFPIKSYSDILDLAR